MIYQRREEEELVNGAVRSAVGEVEDDRRTVRADGGLLVLTRDSQRRGQQNWEDPSHRRSLLGACFSDSRSPAEKRAGALSNLEAVSETINVSCSWAAG